MWELLTELELWVLDLQLGDFQPPILGLVVVVVIGLFIGFLSLQIVIWRNRVDFLSQLLASASFIFPPPVVRLKVVIAGVLIVGALWYLLR